MVVRLRGGRFQEVGVPFRGVELRRGRLELLLWGLLLLLRWVVVVVVGGVWVVEWEVVVLPVVPWVVAMVVPTWYSIELAGKRE